MGVAYENANKRAPGNKLGQLEICDYNAATVRGGKLKHKVWLAGCLMVMVSELAGSQG